MVNTTPETTVNMATCGLQAEIIFISQYYLNAECTFHILISHYESSPRPHVPVGRPVFPSARSQSYKGRGYESAGHRKACMGKGTARVLVWTRVIIGFWSQTSTKEDGGSEDGKKKSKFDVGKGISLEHAPVSCRTARVMHEAVGRDACHGLMLYNNELE